MSNNIDNRIVFMKFDNEQFEKGIKTTVDSLGELNQSLQLEGIASGIQDIASKLSVVGASVFTVVQEITKSILGLGKTMFNAVTTPIVEGGKKRALAIEQAKFQFKGLGMDVTATMESALAAVKGTAYGLDEAATAAAMFGASGLRAGKEMTNALRGISGVAAMSGSSYADVADVFTKVAGQGRLMGDDLNRLASRGINAAATLGKAMGKTEAQVREMVTKGQINFKLFATAMNDAFGEHATKASETFTGSLSNMRAALARIGAAHYAYQYEALRISFNALTPVIDNFAVILLRLTNFVGPRLVSFAEKLADLLGKLDLAHIDWAMRHFVNTLETFSQVATAVFGAIAEAFRDVFPKDAYGSLRRIHRFFEIIDYGTRPLLEAIKNLDNLKRVFRGVFSIFSLAFKLISFGINVFKTFVQILFTGSGVAKTVSSSFGELILKFFDFFTELNASADKSQIFEEALVKLAVALSIIRINVQKFIDGIKDLVGGMSGIKSAFDPISQALDTFSLKISAARDSSKGVKGALSDMGGSAGTGLVGFFSRLGEAVKTGIANMINGLRGLGDALAKTFDFVTFENAVKVFFTLLTGAGFVMVFKFFKNLYDTIMSIINIGVGFSESVIGVLDGLTGALKGMQNNLNAQAIKNIAIAVAILAASVVVISFLDPAKVAKGTLAITILLTEVMAIFAAFNKWGGVGTSIVQAGIAMNFIAVAILILVGSLAILGNMDQAVLTQGLTALSVLLLLVTGSAISLSGMEGKVISAGIAVVLFAFAISKLIESVEYLGEMDMETLVQGLIALGVMFGLLMGLVKSVNADELANFGINMLLLSAAIFILAKSIELLGEMDVDALKQGLGTMMAIFGLLIITINTIPEDASAKALGLLILAGAIVVMAVALKMLGSMSVEEIGKSLITLALALTILVVALLVLAQPNILVGALALAIVSASLILLATAMKMLGGLSWEEIGKSLIALAAAFVIIGLAALVLTPVIIPLIGLGLGILLLGVGFMAAGIGVAMFAAGIGSLALALQSGGSDIIDFIVQLSERLPEIARNIAKGLGAFAAELVTQQGVMTEALLGMIVMVIKALDKALPTIFKFLGKVLVGIIDLVVSYQLKLAEAAMILLLGILDALNEFLPQIIESAGDLMVAFIDGLAEYYDKIIKAGANFIIKIIEGIGRESKRIITAALETILEFITGLTTAIRNNGRKISNAAADLIDEFAYQLGYAAGRMNFMTIGKQIVDGVIAGIKASTGNLPAPIRTVVRKALGLFERESGARSPAKKFMPIGNYWVQGIIVGIEKSTSDVGSAAKNVVNSAYSAMQSAGNQALDLFDGLEEPTIKPVVDLDNVYAGAKAISALMSDASAVKAASTANARLSQTSNANMTSTDEHGKIQDVTLNQYNYSPKSLSRLEIYRQTRNQLQTLKGVVN